MKEIKVPKDCYVSRDISWLSFNERVLNRASDMSVPLLERLKFLSIYYSNLEEFFMVRVGSLVHSSLYMPGYKDIKTGRTSEEELKKIYQEVSNQQKKAQDTYDKLIADLASDDIAVVDFKHLSKGDETITRKMFADYKDILAARLIDDEHPMPFLTGGESFCIVELQKGTKIKYGLIPLRGLPKFRNFEGHEGNQKVVIVSDLIAFYADEIFKKYAVKKRYIIKITRNADVFFEDYEKPEISDSRFDMKKLLKKRKRQGIVRVQICGKPTDEFIEFVKTSFTVTSKQIYASHVPFDLGFTKVIKPKAHQVYSPQKPEKTVKLAKGEIIPYLKKNDMLLSFPYQSITPFMDLVYEAADNPNVEKICITLYRLSASSRLAAALAYAADKGKEVLCLLELRARFDEQNNIDYSEVLEAAGCTVIYGLENLKVHSKLMMIKMNNGDGSYSYITQLGTGNYNEITSEQYADISIITSNHETGLDAESAFSRLLLGEAPDDTDNLIFAPKGFKRRLLEDLDREIAKGKDGRVTIKVNSINDMDVMKKFIECSKSGVKVELLVRGICCLIPGIAGVTENITVKSIIGRYLEHSRVYAFGSGKDQRLYIGSGDLLNRNTQRRVEAFIEVKSKELKEQVLEIVRAYKEDINNSWIMQPDGSYQKLPSAAGKDSFEELANYFRSKLIGEKQEESKPSLLKRLFGK